MNKRYMDFVPREGAAKNTSARSSQTVKSGSAGTGAAVEQSVDDLFAGMNGASYGAESLDVFEEEIVKKPKKKAIFGVIEDYKPKFLKTEVTKRPLGARRSSRAVKNAAGGAAKVAGASGAGSAATAGGARAAAKTTGAAVRTTGSTARVTGTGRGVAARSANLGIAGAAGANARMAAATRKNAAPDAKRATVVRQEPADKAFASMVGASVSSGRRASAASRNAVASRSATAGSGASVASSGKAASHGSVRKSPFVNTEKITKRPLSKNVYPRKTAATAAKEEPSGLVTIITKPEKDSRAGMIVAIIITIILGAAAGTVAFLLLPK